MISTLISVGVALLASLIGVVSWLMVAHVKHSRSNTHQTPEERAAVLKAIEQQMKAHSDLDDARFKTIEKMLEEVRADIKTLLRRRK